MPPKHNGVNFDCFVAGFISTFDYCTASTDQDENKCKWICQKEGTPRTATAS